MTIFERHREALVRENGCLIYKLSMFFERDRFICTDFVCSFTTTFAKNTPEDYAPGNKQKNEEQPRDWLVERGLNAVGFHR